MQNVLSNPTQTAWSTMIAKYPQQREAFESARKGFGEERLTNEFNQGFSVSMALENGKPEVAMEQLKTIIAAKKNAGEPTQIYDQVFTALESGNTKGAQAGVNMALSMMDPDRFQKTVTAQTKAATAPSEINEAIAKAKTAQATATNAPAKAAADAALAAANAAKAGVEANFAERIAQSGLNKTNWDVKNLQSQINDRAEKLNLDKQTTAATVAEKLASIQGSLSNIPADTRKLINESATLAAASKQSADQFNSLANRIEAEGGNYGLQSSATDFLKKAAGFQGGAGLCGQRPVGRTAQL
jgi:hypothetical protein